MGFYQTKTTYEKNRFIREVISGKLASVATEAERLVEVVRNAFLDGDRDYGHAPA